MFKEALYPPCLSQLDFSILLSTDPYSASFFCSLAFFRSMITTHPRPQVQRKMIVGIAPSQNLRRQMLYCLGDMLGKSRSRDNKEIYLGRPRQWRRRQPQIRLGPRTKTHPIAAAASEMEQSSQIT